MTQLQYVSKKEFDRVRQLDCAAATQCALFAGLARINTLYMIAAAGSGHIGSSFSSLDIVSWLYLQELGEDDLYFSSKGHDAPGLYSVLTALGIIDFDKIHSLRRLNGLPGHPDVSIAGMPTNTGSLGMGVSKAKGLLKGLKMAGKNPRIYVLTGDGELQEGQFWESLASAANNRLHEITVIVDHNKIQSDTWVAETSDLGNLAAKFTAFGWHVQRVDGHDYTAFSQALRQARNEKNLPSVIIADTVKGKGVSFMEPRIAPEDRSLYKYHSGAPSDGDYQAGLQELTLKVQGLLASCDAPNLFLETIDRPLRPGPRNPQRLPAAYANALAALGARRPDIVVLDADLKLDCGLLPFEELFPERFVECGIAEQDMVSQAGGLALTGKLPMVHSFACFLTPRANEQIYNNATEKTKIIYCGFLAGLLPAGPGHSHQSVRDLDILAAVPDLSLVQPCCEQEVAMIVDFCADTMKTSSYLRFTSIPCEIDYTLPPGYRIEPGKGCALRQGKDILIISYGPVMLNQAFRATVILEKESGIQACLINLPWLNTFDTAWLAATAAPYPMIITIDDHYVRGGQGEMLAATLSGLGLGIPVHSFGVPEIPACGTNDEVLCHHRLDAVSLAKRIAEIYIRMNP